MNSKVQSRSIHIQVGVGAIQLCHTVLCRMQNTYAGNEGRLAISNTKRRAGCRVVENSRTTQVTGTLGFHRYKVNRARRCVVDHLSCCDLAIHSETAEKGARVNIWLAADYHKNQLRHRHSKFSKVARGTSQGT
jgi:hypothetical protein